MSEASDAVNQFRSSRDKLWDLWIANETRKVGSSAQVLALAERIKKHEDLKQAATAYCNALWKELDE